MYFRQRQSRHSILEGMQSLCTSDGGRFAKAPWYLGCSPHTGGAHRGGQVAHSDAHTLPKSHPELVTSIPSTFPSVYPPPNDNLTPPHALEDLDWLVTLRM